MLLTIADRDGTLIESVEYLGKEDNWKDKIIFKFPVINLLREIQNDYKSKIYVITNQSGVARKYFDCLRVENINKYLNYELSNFGVKIDGWNYCPNVDNFYAFTHQEIDFNPKFIKEKSGRKPSIDMVLETLEKNNLSLSDFENMVVLGDSDVDKILAKNLKGSFIDVKEKDYKQLNEEFLSFINKGI